MATVAFKSPNACNICHSDHDAAWADRHVRAWRKRDYQKPVLYRAGLVAAARKGNWAQLGEMLQYLTTSTSKVKGPMLTWFLTGTR